MPDQFAEQIKKLDALRRAEDSSALEEFDDEAEALIIRHFDEASPHLEAYELAMMGEAETIVNMPQAAQEDSTQDLFHKSIAQRRQVLEGCLADVALMESVAQPATPKPTKKKTGKTPKPTLSKKKHKKPGPAKKTRATRT